MPKTYALADKIAAHLKSTHGIKASVEETQSEGVKVTAGRFQEALTGLINKTRLSDLAERIKAANG